LRTNRRGFLGGMSTAAGASDAEIKIGHTISYSGPASAYGVEGQLHQAFFKAVNEAAGINGRKATFISYDDRYRRSRAASSAMAYVVLPLVSDDNR
jgi:branched-chain amino acid transport system substrate-binding protein